MQHVILDASALIAVICGETGATIVERHLAHAIISAVNIAEVASYITSQGIEIKEAESMLADLALTVRDYTQEHAFLTAALRPKTKSKGLSLGDRACLALALSEKLPVLTADKTWAKLDIGARVQLIR